MKLKTFIPLWKLIFLSLQDLTYYQRGKSELDCWNSVKVVLSNFGPQGKIPVTKYRQINRKCQINGNNQTNRQRQDYYEKPRFYSTNRVTLNQTWYFTLTICVINISRIGKQALHVVTIINISTTKHN